MSTATNSFYIARANPVWKGFWDTNLELEDPALNCPQPCKWAERCVYNGPGGCGFVHPAEVGKGRKLLEKRVETTATGETRILPAVVRLFGGSFYERRKLRLSWPEWCRRQNMPAPVPLSAVAKPAVVTAVPCPEAPRLTIVKKGQAPLICAESKHTEVLLRRRLMDAVIHAVSWVAHSNRDKMRLAGLHHPDCFNPYLLANVLVEKDPIQVDELMRVPNVERLLALMVEAGKFLYEAKKNSVGMCLYTKVQKALNDTSDTRAILGFAGPHFTAGKITGMILEDLVEAEILCKPESEEDLGSTLMEACEVLKKYKKED
jgi:hypothetical protein